MGYEQLLTILRQNEEEFIQELEAERDNPLDCPNDGEPLRDGPDGYPHCNFDGWRPDNAPHWH